MSMLDCLPAGAQTAAIEQNFAAFTRMPTTGHYAFISQGRPIRIIRN